MAASGTASGALNVSELIDNSPVRPLHITIFTLCALCMIMDGFDVQALGYVVPAIAAEWNVPPPAFAQVAAFSNFGVLTGQLLFTMLADKIGRRPVLIGGALFFSVMTILVGFANTIPQLLAIRFIAGMGLGSIIPNATALIGEFAPRKVRVMLVTWLGVGFTAGAAMAGFVATWMLPRFGWRAVFYFGGAVPLVLAVVMIFLLPESLKLLVLSGRRSEYVAKWLKRIAPDAPITPSTTFVVHEEKKSGVPIMHLFGDGRAMATILLWGVNFMNLLNLYSLSFWLPTVLRTAGYSQSTSLLVSTTLQVGGTLSPFLLAWLVVRRGFIPVLTVTLGIGAVAIAMIGQPGLSLVMLTMVVFVAGACVVGGQPSINALSATFYPTYLRSTGLGWALGIGRAGSIVGPLVTAWFISNQFTTQQIFFVLAVPALLSTMFIFMLSASMKGLKA